MPAKINSNWRLDSFPTSSVRSSRSSVTIWDVLATESLGRPVTRAERMTLPGASAQPRLLVKGTQTTVRTRLRLSESPWTTTIQRLQVYVSPRQKRQDRSTYQSPRRLDSSPRSQRQDRDARRIRSRLPYKPGFVTSSVDGITSRHHGKSYREWRSLSSYPEYNQATVRVQTYGAVRVIK